jgi:S1-C subfamily serine protease
MLVVALASVLATGLVVHADDAADGRAIAAKSGNAVVKIQLVMKIGFSSEGRSEGSKEVKMEATGTVIDPSGLLVTSLSQTNPADMFSSLMEGGSITSEVTDLKIRLVDGTEIPGKVVLRDKDLDLAFIRPSEKPSAPMQALDLKDSSSAEMLDQVLILNRLGKASNRALSASLDRIQSVVEKPRKVYAATLSGGRPEVGSPVFAMNGKVIGLLLLKMSPSSTNDKVMAVIVPSGDILEVAAQAPEDAPKAAEKPGTTKAADGAAE